MTVLDSLSGAVRDKHIPANGETLSSLLDVYAPRLSRATIPKVPEAFKHFWSTFGKVEAMDLSEDVGQFLDGVREAVPGLIEAKSSGAVEDISAVCDLLRPHFGSY